MQACSLDRRLGPVDAAAIVIANVIGVGIFTTPGFVATIVPNAHAIVAVWIAGGALAFFGALAYAELAARRPLAGGEYIYLRESFGDVAAFLTGWTSFVAGFSGAIAAGAVGVSVYADRFVPGVANSKTVAIGIITVLAVIHVRGLGPGRTVQMALTAIKVAGLIMFGTVGFASGGPTATPASAGGSVAPSALLLAMIPVMFSYSGWNAAAYIAEEVRDPSRNVPLGLAIGTTAVVTLYVSMNALYVRGIPPQHVLGDAAGSLFNAVAVVIMLSSLSAMTLAGPRVYFAMARNGAFFPAAARVHPRYRTPAIAIASQAAWSALLVLSGTFEQLLTYTGFAVILFSGLAVLSLFFVHRRARDVPGRWAWGYPWAPAIFCVASFSIIVNATVTAPGPTLAGLAVMVAGLPIYWWTRARNKSAKVTEGAPNVADTLRKPFLLSRFRNAR
jgi:APA family basic amino acid/polyamine antiporter